MVRHETRSDAQEMARITEDAFKGNPLSHGTEHYTIDGLRASGALTISLVAVIDNRIAGHVAFSPVKIANRHDDWYGLGPVSVRPDVQKQRIDTELIVHGLEMLRSLGLSSLVKRHHVHFGFLGLGVRAEEDAVRDSLDADII